ncbi:RNA polymerase sigma-70 factor [Aestuariivivens insulae]|uniref:RNA polymerase sigma-70 factor n=1 Tax=Aestuariivivens insulae TaxID=1621988 RepID=UPI001F5A6AE3|nr:RNA polymerase sigma-70 factor [Aestuariivivens insulae]
MPPQAKTEYFSLLFDKQYPKLCNYALTVVGDKDISKELVQEAFIKLWKRLDSISPDNRSIESYLITVLKNNIIDFYRKEQVRKKHIDLYKHNRETQNRIEGQWEITSQIEQVYATLPEKTVEIFKLSRVSGLSYKEIAELKGISIKTVELHMSKALTAFKKGLKDFL